MLLTVLNLPCTCILLTSAVMIQTFRIPVTDTATTVSSAETNKQEVSNKLAIILYRKKLYKGQVSTECWFQPLSPCVRWDLMMLMELIQSGEILDTSEYRTSRLVASTTRISG